jgi:hypothetical protein
MRPVDPLAQAEREKRSGIAERYMLWIAARNRETNAIEALGLWTGDDTETITVTDLWTGASATRVFQGAGAMLGVAGVQHKAGLDVRPLRLSLSAIDATTTAAVRLYDARGGKVQIWKRTLSADTGLQVGQPEPLFKGFVNRAPIPRPVAGGEAVLELECVSSVRLLTIPAGRNKSDAAQRLRSGDRFRRYKASVETIDVPWGQEDDRE